MFVYVYFISNSLARGRRAARSRGRSGEARAPAVMLEEPLEEPNFEQPEVPEFTGQPGLKVEMNNTTPLDFFELFLTDAIIDHLVAETNRYAQQTIETSHPQRRFARLRNWRDTNKAEMRKFIGLVFLTGLVSKPTIASYWSQQPILHTPIFHQMMPRNRFQALLRFWHCNDNKQEPPRNHPNRDRLFKVRPLLAHLEEKFQTVYKPEKDIAIDESLLLWKGQLIFKQYIPLKRARFGIKIFNVCEKSGYTYKLRVYTGKEDPAFAVHDHVPEEAAHLSASEKIVVYMTEDLLDQGYRLYMDNWYSGARLYEYLLRRRTVCCGTLRSNRAPRPVQDLELSAEEPMKALRSGQLLFMKWQSSKIVYMISTMHNKQMQEVVKRGGRRVNKPSCVVDYNSNMGAVDRVDQMLQPYDATRKTQRWYKKLMIHLLQIALLNSFLLFKKTNINSHLDFLLFQCQVISDLLYTDQPAPDPALPMLEDVSRLKERHFPRKVPSTGGRHTTTRRCRVCSKQGDRKETTFLCEQCPSQPPLCVVPCFEIWHTQKKL